VLARPRPEDVLEQREPLDAHLQPVVRGQIVAEALHEQRQHLVDVDQDQRPLGGKADFRELWNGGGGAIGHRVSGRA